MKLSLKWKRKCPSCGNELYYSHHFTMVNSEKEGKCCKKCTHSYVTSADFAIKSQRIHGMKYCYDKVRYKNSGEKVEIICPTHGSFWQVPYHHTNGSGCPKCYHIKVGNNCRMTNDEFIIRAKLVHDDFYNYSEVVYYNWKTKIKISCPKHGYFFQTPNSHLQGQGCSKCSSNISVPEIEFLDYLNIHRRNVRLPEWKSKPVDGICGKTVYEFLGDYWHGNPKKFVPNDIHPRLKKSFGELYKNTFQKLNKIKSFGYDVKFIWEMDWKKFKCGITLFPKIYSL